MYISDLALNDFRSYEDAVIRLNPSINVFIGENGQGKTNIVEAIGYLATFSSHRVAADAALVRQGAPAGVIRAKIWNGEQHAVIELEIIAGKANRARLNRGNIKPSEILGMVRTVLFSPEDLELVKGDPSARRRFLDSLMIQMKPRMQAVKAEYEKVLRQRGALLKSLKTTQRRTGRYDESALDVWDEQLARLGAQIISSRVQIIRGLRESIAEFYADVSGSASRARIDYLANVINHLGMPAPDPQIIATEGEKADALRAQIDENEKMLADIARVENMMHQQLRSVHSREIDRGVTLVGPHRDDLQLTLDTFPARGFASHGESWSYALAIKLASWKYLSNADSGILAGDDEPILILDDVFAELDAKRRQRLAQIVTQAQQVLVTAAVGEDLPSGLEGTRFYVTRGSVERISEP
ncbi:MAG: DNA replication/repair protein RecF [Actinomycetaceae bacterium]|nr:DNA replication/repair protein RecF [Arcanobacterium sp.]MDD7505456.1 DNA replication/repair protein RecF [Actinomycetaceae bacterium]MDY6144045.1 DNA replication/repair protein RecF [Arcanobacterium sp.]